MAPVRARIPSSSVVLPLWNGPTSPIHRDAVFCGTVCASFQAGGGLGKRRQRLTHDGGTRMDMRALHANKNGRLGGRPCIARSLRNRQGPGRRCSSATPRALFFNDEATTETGCNATVLLEPPMRTLAPRPAATVT